MVSGVQGLDPKENFQSFMGLVRVKECISGVSKDPRDLAIWPGYQFQEGFQNTKIISEIFW